MSFDWKITRNRKTQVTTLQVFQPNGNLAAEGSGKDNILKRLFPDLD
jgi:hypothetical protein